MTQEEKAKAYDNVVNKLRRFMAQGVEPLITRADVQDFFPELKESEDEKIRKWLIGYFQRNKVAEVIKTHDILAWLEKQGEQKPTKYTLEQAAHIFLDALSDTPYNNSPITDAQVITNELLKFLSNTSSYNPNTINEQKPVDKVEPKFKVKYAGNEYNVFETKDIAGVTFYGIEDEPNHIDYVKAENCEIISVYAIKENGSPYPTKPAVFSEKKPKRMISAEAKECIYGSDNEQVSSEKIGKNDTLLDLLNKMPSYITVDGIDYHFVLKKTIAYETYYEGVKEGREKTIFWTGGDPVDILTEMLEKLKEKGLLE